MTGWDTTPVAAGGADWKAEEVTTGDWAPEATAAHGGEDEFTDGFKPENISKHNGGDAPSDGGCRICHADDHFVRDCPEKKDNTGECYNCGEMGHSKAECTNPHVEREFTGTCRFCEKQGHRAADCSDKPAEKCRVCGQEGHIATNCAENRLFVIHSGMALLTAEEAWKAIEKADEEKDFDDIKMAIFAYAKAFPALTLKELESAFREAGMNTHLIAKEQEISGVHTIVNFQGEPNKKYVVSFQRSATPRRAKFADGWPSTQEENLERLTEAGFVLDSLQSKCDNCGEMGHTRRKCEQEAQEREKPVISCAVCSEEGHRARDCTQARKSARTCKICEADGHIAKDCPNKEPDICRNCGEEGHRAKECEKERVIKCRNCDEEGHISKECDKPRDISRVQCRNCDEYGHTGRDCKKPTDWSRVECSNCKEKGHTYKRCPKPEGGEEDAGGDSGW